MNNDLLSALRDYVSDTECPEKNYRLAGMYYGMGHTAAALTFYLRTAERTDDVALSYECLLVMGLCFEAQSNRGNSARGMYKQAMMLLPNRPEAYFLLARNYEQSRLYMDGYVTAELGMRLSTGTHPPLRGYVQYPGEYALLFEKAVTSWWWGREMEARQLFRQLSREYHHVLDEPHLSAVYSNLAQLGIGPQWITHKTYSPDKHVQLRRQFPGSESITHTYGQVYQDLFVLMCLDGKLGRYLEIGSAGPYYGNNTALLEQLGWIGQGIEFDPAQCDVYREHRTNPVDCRDATKITAAQWSAYFGHSDVDYISLDCDPPHVTYAILQNLPLDRYKAAVITYEHDAYCDVTQMYARLSREYLTALGYVLVVPNVSPDGESAFEDWWVHPDLIDPEILAEMLPSPADEITPIDDYILSRGVCLEPA